MSLEVYDPDDKLICFLNDNDALLGSFNIEDNYRIHVSLPFEGNFCLCYLYMLCKTWLALEAE